MKEPRPVFSVYLNATYYEMRVSEETYQQILALAQSGAVCVGCREDFTQDNPMVASIICLNCFLKDDHEGLTFYGLLDPVPPEAAVYLSPHAPFPQRVYLFFNKEGHAYLTRSGPGEGQKASANSRYTLKYWHFPIPTTAILKGEEIDTSEYSWEIHGDVQDDLVILQHGEEFYKNEILFISVKNTQYVRQINKRRALDKEQFAQARAELEATKNAEGEYLVEGKWQPWVRTSDIYRHVAKGLKNRLFAQQETLPLTEETTQ